MTTPERRVATSVLVISAGGSGLRAALELAERGADVLEREAISPIPDEIAALMRDVSTAGKLVE